MPLWNKKSAPTRETIAKIEGRYVKNESTVAIIFLILGGIAMLAAFFVETSAIRLAAWGAIWTGWNVLCAIAVMSKGGTITYTVYRELPPNEPKFDA